MQTFHIDFKSFHLELGPETCIMGILNVTPDSFSDGGRFNNLETAVGQGMRLVREGAQILDIGGESSRPFADPVTEQEEMDRVIPVIEALAPKIKVPISIDTVKPAVAEAAIEAGAAIINDISAFEKDPAMADLAARKKVPVVLMHMKGTPETMQINPDYGDLMAEITGHLAQRAEFALSRGIEKSRIILDPGIGFGKTVTHNLVIIQQLAKIADLGFPVLMGTSRKSFIQKILGQDPKSPVGPVHEDTEAGTLATLGASIFNGAHILRVHDVARAAAFTRILDAVRNA